MPIGFTSTGGAACALATLVILILFVAYWMVITVFLKWELSASVPKFPPGREETLGKHPANRTLFSETFKKEICEGGVSHFIFSLEGSLSILLRLVLLQPSPAGRKVMYVLNNSKHQWNEPLEPLTVLDSPLLMQWDANCISNSSSWWTSGPDGENCLWLGRANLNHTRVPQNNLSSSHGYKREGRAGTAADTTQPKVLFWSGTSSAWIKRGWESLT